MAEPQNYDDADDPYRAIRIGDPGFAGEATKWGHLLTRFMRVMAAFWLMQGLAQWHVVLTSPKPIFDAMPQSAALAVVFFGVLDLVAGVGLWLATPWGGVLWLLIASAQIFVAASMPTFFAGGYWLIAVNLVLIVLYFGLTFEAGRDFEAQKVMEQRQRRKSSILRQAAPAATREPRRGVLAALFGGFASPKQSPAESESAGGLATEPEPPGSPQLGAKGKQSAGAKRAETPGDPAQERCALSGVSVHCQPDLISTRASLEDEKSVMLDIGQSLFVDIQSNEGGFTRPSRRARADLHVQPFGLASLQEGRQQCQCRMRRETNAGFNLELVDAGQGEIEAIPVHGLEQCNHEARLFAGRFEFSVPIPWDVHSPCAPAVGSSKSNRGILEFEAGVLVSEVAGRGDAPFLAEMVHGGVAPVIAPSQHEIGQIRPVKGWRRDIGGDCGWLDVHGSAGGSRCPAHVDVLMQAQQALVQRPELLEKRGSTEHAMEFDEVALRSLQRRGQSIQTNVNQAMLVIDDPLAILLLEMERATRHVDQLLLDLADEIKRRELPYNRQ